MGAAVHTKGVCVWLCACVCKDGWGQKTNGDEQDGTEGKKVEKGVTTRVIEGRRWWWGGIKWFNYKPNTISLFLTRDFMVWANVWQKQLSATNAKALHSARSAGPFWDGRQLLLNFIVRIVFCFFFPAGINDASTWAWCKTPRCNLPPTPSNTTAAPEIKSAPWLL